MKLSRLSALERDKIEQERADLETKNKLATGGISK